jgi:hypothetical protein
MLVNASKSGAITGLTVCWHKGTTWNGTARNSKKMLLSLTETIVEKLSDHPSYVHSEEWERERNREYKWYVTLIRRLDDDTFLEYLPQKINLIRWCVICTNNDK